MLRPLLPLIRTLSRTGPAADAELLDRFARARDEDAFAELVRRHGPAVSYLCRRLVGADAADDAFQATFLVLATRLPAARAAASLGSWLVGTAGRVARQMRRTAARRVRHEAAASVTETTIESRVEEPSSTADDLRVLDEELACLPDRLRAPVVLCFLQGRTQDEAAGVLGQTSRTVRRRLDEAKRRLRMRLERRGVTPAVAGGLVAAAGSAVDGVAAGLIERTTAVVVGFLTGQAALSPPVILANGVARTMRMRSLTLFGVVTAVGLAAIGIGLAGGGPPIGAPPSPAPIPPPGVFQEIKPTPPEPSDDERFLREVCQKLRGTPPTTAELGYFIGDPDPTKRAKVTRWLSPEHQAKAARPGPAAVEAPPSELTKVVLPPYMIEAPDTLLVEVLQKGEFPVPDPAKPGQNLKKRDQDGKETDVLVPGTQRLSIQPISGSFLVRVDGTVGLGFWGAVRVAGKTLEQASAAIRQHLLESKTLKEAEVKSDNLVVIVDVLAYNSKRYYVVLDGGGYGEQVYPFPITGSECVLDALGNVKGLAAPEAAKRCIWLARRGLTPNQTWQILPVDWIGITQHGQTLTNYQIMPGDRIYVSSQPEGPEQEVLLSLDAPDDIFLLRACMILRGNAPTSIEAGYFLADKASTKRAKILRWVRADRQDSRQQGKGAAPSETAPPTPFPEIEVTVEDGKVRVRGLFPASTVKGQGGKTPGGGKKFEVVCKTFQTLADGRLQFTGGDGELARFTSYEPSGAIVSESTARRIIYSPATGSYNVEVNATMKAPEKSAVNAVNSFRSTSTGH